MLNQKYKLASEYVNQDYLLYNQSQHNDYIINVKKETLEDYRSKKRMQDFKSEFEKHIKLNSDD